MKIECPECFKDNNIVIAGGTECEHCEKLIDEYRYVRKLMPWFVLLLIGGGGTFATSEYFETTRYSITAEYGLVEKCTNLYREVLKFQTLEKKNKICIEALERTQDEFSFSDALEDKRKFFDEFEKNVVASYKKK